MIKALFSPGHAAVSCAGGALPGGAFERSTGAAAAGAPRETWMMLKIGGDHSDSEIGISKLINEFHFPSKLSHSSSISSCLATSMPTATRLK